MSNFDFKKYSLEDNIHLYDGFIDQNGNFYKVKLKNQDHYDEVVTHYTWAEKYCKEVLDADRLKLDPHYSTIYMLSVLKDNLNLLIHYYGFVYYSHSHFLHEPIVIYPTGEFDKIPSKVQLETLWEIMSRNNEAPEKQKSSWKILGNLKKEAGYEKDLF